MSGTARRPRPGARRAPWVQLAGLHAVSPTRVRFDASFNDWAQMTAEDRKRAQQPLPRERTLRLAWSLYADDGGSPMGWRSTPVPVALGERVWKVLRHKCGLATVTRVDALCWAHLAQVVYRDGRAAVYGHSSPPATLADAETLGFPLAWVVGGGVRPFDGGRPNHGHLTEELLAAPRFERPAAPAAEAEAPAAEALGEAAS